MRKAGVLIRLFALLLPLALGWRGPVLAAAPAILSDGDRIDLSSQAEWCETSPRTRVESVAGGGCAFTPGVPARSSSDNAFWLRLSIVNSGGRQAERWLGVGHPRLRLVRFFEPSPDGGWRHTDAGYSIPAAERPLLTTDPVLPLVFAPGESKTLLIRVTTPGFIDPAPTLWRPQAYTLTHRWIELLQAMGVGGLLVTVLLTIIISFQWKEKSYIYFSLTLLLGALYISNHTGLISTFLLTGIPAFGLACQDTLSGLATLSFTLFIRHLIGMPERYRRYYITAFLLIAVLAVSTLWSHLVDYQSGNMGVNLASLATEIGGLVLFIRAWRDRHPATGALLACFIAYLLNDLIGDVLPGLLGGGHGDVMSVLYVWGFLLPAPTALIGIAVHKNLMQQRLLTAQAESAARMAFLASMSHELRTPLDTILGTAQLMGRSERQGAQAERIAHIRESGRQLLRMIDEILDHARGGVGKLNLVADMVNWPEFLRAIRYDGQILAAKNNNRFSLLLTGDDPGGLRFDEGRVRQVLDNLLSNAARHTHGGEIRLDCEVRQDRAAGKCRLQWAVSDTGEGIAPADQERIFLPFERVGPSARQGGKGMGMGLAIARQLVDLMGGKLVVQSQPGKGACFRFEIAVDEDRQPEPSSDDLYFGYQGPRRTILLVDDETDHRRILASLLAECGFAVLEADNGREAFGLVQSAVPAVDLVLTDQFMTDGDGWDLLRQIEIRTLDLPVVLLSAAPPDRPAGFPDDWDFAGQLMKPLDHRKLLRCIGDLLGLEWNATATPPPAGTMIGPPGLLRADQK